MEKVRKYWLLLFIACGLIYVGFYLSREIRNVDGTLHVSIPALALTFVVQVAFWYLASFLWRRIVGRISAVDFSLPESFAQLSLVNLGKYLPGKIWGMLARGSRMKQHHGLATAQIIQATYLEQYFLLTSGFAIIALIGGAFLGESWALLLAVLTLAGIMLGGHYSNRILGMIFLVYARITKMSPGDASLPTLSSSQFYLYLLSYGVVWILLGLVCVGIYVSFFAEVITIRVLATIVLASTAAFSAGFLAIFAPGGVGVRETVGSAILASLIPVQDAILLSLLFRLWSVIVELVAGGAVMLTLSRPAR